MLQKVCKCFSDSFEFRGIYHCVGVPGGRPIPNEDDDDDDDVNEINIRMSTLTEVRSQKCEYI
jgi:hypothetical protein